MLKERDYLGAIQFWFRMWHRQRNDAARLHEAAEAAQYDSRVYRRQLRHLRAMHANRMHTLRATLRHYQERCATLTRRLEMSTIIRRMSDGKVERTLLRPSQHDCPLCGRSIAIQERTDIP